MGKIYMKKIFDGILKEYYINSTIAVIPMYFIPDICV